MKTENEHLAQVGAVLTRLGDLAYRAQRINIEMELLAIRYKETELELDRIKKAYEEEQKKPATPWDENGMLRHRQ